MLRFVALHWDPQQLEHATAALALSNQLTASDANWRRAFHCEGLSVFYIPDRLGRDDAYVLPKERGVVLGRLFHHGHLDTRLAQPARTRDLDSEAMLESQGSWLATHVWGRYVAFIRNSSRRQTIVLRDPLGTAQCFETDYRGLRIFSAVSKTATRWGCRSRSIGTMWPQICSSSTLPSVRRQDSSACACCSAASALSFPPREPAAASIGRRLTLPNGCRWRAVMRPWKLSQSPRVDVWRRGPATTRASFTSCPAVWIRRSLPPV